MDPSLADHSIFTPCTVDRSPYEQWIVLDCANIYTMDTSASAVVGTTIKKMASKGWKLALCECTPRYRAIQHSPSALRAIQL
jgi:hypothetical protein